MTPRILLLAVTATLAAGGLARADHPQRTYVPEHADVQISRYRPHHVDLRENDGLFVTGIHWTKYNRHVARGYGTGAVAPCRIDCTPDQYRFAPVRIRLWRPHRYCTRRLFSRVRLRWTHGRPFGGPATERRKLVRFIEC